MSSDKTSRKHQALLSDGPMTAEALGGHPGVDERRIYDIQKFNPKDQTTAIWYLESHDKERVLRDWFEANKQSLRSNNVGKRSMSYALTGEWMDVWREINVEAEFDWLGENDSGQQSGSGEHSMQTCPKCGDDDIKNLPRHLRGCDGGDEDSD